MKKFFLLNLLSLIMISTLNANDTISIKKATFKEIFYILEKNGYNITYNIDYDNLKYMFNKKIEFKKLTTLSLNELFEILTTNKTFIYKIEDKKIEFYKKPKKKKRKKKKINNKIKLSDNNINEDIKIVINNNNSIKKYKKILMEKFDNKNLLYIKLNYYNKDYNLYISKNSYKNFLDNLKINKNIDLLKIKDKDKIFQSKKTLEKNLEKISSYVFKQKKLINNIIKNIDDISYKYYPYINSYIKYHNRKYYFIGNIDYKNNLSNLKNNKDLLFLFNEDEEFNYYNFKCKIVDSDIICKNKNNLLKIKGGK